MGFEDRRVENRTNIEIKTLVFLGSRPKDGVSFEYCLFNISRYGLQIGVIPPEKGMEGLLKEQDLVALHLALMSPEEIFDHARVMWTEYDENKRLLVCGSRLEEGPNGPEGRATASERYYLSLSLDTSDIVLLTSAYASANDLLLSLLEASLVLKKRMLGAVDKAACFLPVAEQSHKDPHSFVGRAITVLNEDRVRVEVWCREFSNQINSRKATPAAPELADVRTVMRSDLYAQCIGLARPERLDEKVFEEIRDLEQQLLVNYNTIALLWFGYLAYMYQNI